MTEMTYVLSCALSDYLNEKMSYYNAHICIASPRYESSRVFSGH